MTTADEPGGGLRLYEPGATVDELTQTRRLFRRVRQVARRITQRVQKATGEDAPEPSASERPDHPRPPVWRGDSVMLRHHPDGTVAATSRGRVGVGASEEDALRELGRLLPPPTDPPAGNPWRVAGDARDLDARAAAADVCQLLRVAVAYRRAGRAAEAAEATVRASVMIAVAVAEFDRRVREVRGRVAAVGITAGGNVVPVL